MKKWMLLLSLFSAASYSSSDFSSEGIAAPDLNSQDFKPPEVSRQEQNNIVCESVVCNSTSVRQPVPVVGEVPDREPNKTIETLASAIYIVGEIGVAENLSTPEYEKFFEN
ncbi:hypothetical protein AB4455_13255 [Vibrio sp. 10N.261.46.E12]|uniref:hypothetical protein n=1 Tax=unclassified Vibrio TaxID=2614977 RepID=UPI0009766E3F|nr:MULTISPECIES: hypothetical protein [unclassified Vibrio]OMO33800.1 hypothetical protein BH584_14190 [Vibrio sp. 10N.261.45.E1]PMJ19574.1 hypothetical protein BCU27_21355 [Vibrio sp. 10N.286.45.B6]PML93926.1 hypothetical protein BCT66_02600 [Vibrio sp. 10N.261.49.E11]PMM77711.1 hypothetical protein BCT48_23540 [Vibrio sp. 10N.261.46.F12]PMM81000.1 hypothetical protein BCT46_16840 [Vibrio sp. 10N.261.46.E8]